MPSCSLWRHCNGGWVRFQGTTYSTYQGIGTWFGLCCDLVIVNFTHVLQGCLLALGQSLPPVPVKESWWIWVNRLHDTTKNWWYNHNKTECIFCNTDLTSWNVLNKHKHIWIFYHSLTLKWHRYLKYFLRKHNDTFILHSQYHGC